MTSELKGLPGLRKGSSLDKVEAGSWGSELGPLKEQHVLSQVRGRSV